MTNKRIVYIAGYGRSGSTLLDMLLDNNEEIIGVGELIFLFDEYKNNPALSPFWKNIVENLLKETAEFTIDDLEQLSWDTQNHLKNTSKADQQKYMAMWKNILNQIFEAYPNTIILDSSKSSRLTFHRPLLLKKAGYDLKIIHLVRDPRAVMHSVSKGSNRLLEKGKKSNLFGAGYKGLFSWIYVNTIARRYYKVFNKEDIIRIRYEDLIEHPTETINKLINFIGLKQTVINNLKEGHIECTPGIGISGNRLRRQSNKIILRKDYSWKNKISSFDNIVAKTFAFRLMKKFGYV